MSFLYHYEYSNTVICAFEWVFVSLCCNSFTHILFAFESVKCFCIELMVGSGWRMMLPENLIYLFDLFSCN